MGIPHTNLTYQTSNLSFSLERAVSDARQPEGSLSLHDNIKPTESESLINPNNLLVTFPKYMQKRLFFYFVPIMKIMPLFSDHKIALSIP